MATLEISDRLAEKLYHLASLHQVSPVALIESSLDPTPSSDDTLFRRFFDISIDMLCTASPDGYFLEVSPSFEKALGYTRYELTSISFLELIHPDDRPATLAELEKLGAGEPTLYFENRYRHQDGSYRWLAWTSSAADERGIIYAIARDITQQKRNENALQASEEKYRQLFFLTPASIFTKDRDGHYTSSNDSSYKYSDESVIGKTDYDLQPPDIAAELCAHDQQVMERQQTHIYEEQLMTPTGLHWFLANKAPLYDESGQVMGVLGASLDITERIDIEKALRESEERFRTVVTAMDDVIFTLDRDHRHTGAYGGRFVNNPQAVENFVGKTAIDMLGEKNGVLHIEANHRALNGEQVVYEWSMSSKEGTRHHITSLFPVIDASGEVVEIVGVGRDITPQKQLELALRESEERFRAIYECAKDGIFIIDPEGNYVDVNPAGCEMFGYSHQEFLGLTVDDLRFPEDLTPELKATRAAAWTNGASMPEIRFKKKDGSEIWVSLNVAPLTIGDKSLVLGIKRDITERKAVEDALYFTAQRGWSADEKTFFDALVMYLTDKLKVDYAFIGEVNPEINTISTLAFAHQNKIIPNIHYSLKDTPCENVIGKQLCIYIQNAKTLFPQDADLQDLDIEGYMGVPLWDSRGTPNGIIVLMHTAPLPKIALEQSVLQLVAVRAAHELERLHTDRILRDSEERFRSIFEESPLGIGVTGRDGRFAAVNPTFAKMLGYTVPELLQTSVTDITHPDDIELTLHQRDLLYQKIKPSYQYEKRYVRADGSIFWGRRTSSVILDTDGEIIYTMDMIEDITAQRQAEEARQTAELLKVELDKEKELKELKSRFLSMVAHEFRTPMTVVMISTSLLKTNLAQMTPEQQISRLDKIDAQIMRLNHMIEDVAFINKYELLSHMLQRSPVHIPTFIEQVIEEVLVAYPGEVPIKVDIRGDYPNSLLDELLFHQIITNLLSNAVKYSKPSGEIRLSCQCDADYITITIADQGIGIPEKDQKRLFQVFTRAGNVGKIPGTGLGLVIIKQAIDAHEGNITFHSVPDQGTTFTITLPNIQG